MKRIHIHIKRSTYKGHPIMDPCPPCYYGLNGFCMQCRRPMPVR